MTIMGYITNYNQELDWRTCLGNGPVVKKKHRVPEKKIIPDMGWMTINNVPCFDLCTYGIPYQTINVVRVKKEHDKFKRRVGLKIIWVLCICMYTYIYIYTYVYINIHISEYTYIYIYMYIYRYRYRYGTHVDLNGLMMTG